MDDGVIELAGLFDSLDWLVVMFLPVLVRTARLLEARLLLGCIDLEVQPVRLLWVGVLLS